MPGLRNIEKRLLSIERRFAPVVRPQIPRTLVCAILDRMDEADRQRLSEFKGLTPKQIAAKINDDTDFRAFARRVFAVAGAEGGFRWHAGDSTQETPG
jgi:hypothetical protein